MKIIIYKLLCNKTSNCYIGSTKRNINNRISEHKSNYKNNHGLTKSVEILKNEDYQVIILEEFEINTLDELKIQYTKEREYIEKELNCINKNLPFRTKEDIKKYYENNKIEILKKRSERYIKNRDKELSRQNAYYLDPIKKERIKKYNLERYHRLKIIEKNKLLSSQ